MLSHKVVVIHDAACIVEKRIRQIRNNKNLTKREGDPLSQLVLAVDKDLPQHVTDKHALLPFDI